MSEAENAQWAIVELFGHQRIAGKISEQTIGGCSFVRVDVPEIGAGSSSQAPVQPWTKLFGNGAIYAISFVDEATALLTATTLRVQPINSYDIREALRNMGPGRAQALLGLHDGDDGSDD